MKAIVVAVGLAALLAPPTVRAGAASKTLVPAAGTGHGVLGAPPPAEEAVSLNYSPGLGAACSEEPGRVSASPMSYGRSDHGTLRTAVGLPVSLCIGPFGTAPMHIRITTPGGQTIAVPDPTDRHPTSSSGVEVQFLAGPPSARYQITGWDAVRKRATVAASGRLTGDGSGKYAVRVSGGDVVATTSFTLEPPPVPRLSNLTGLFARVDRGDRLQFGVAGIRPLATFQVGVFGPSQRFPSGNYRDPLLTVITGRADRHGNAIVALDILSNSPTGSGFSAVLDPKTPLADPEGALDPRLAMFEVAAPTTTPPTTTPPTTPRAAHQYAVTDDVNVRADPTSTSASLAVIPSGSQVPVECVTTGEQITGPYGPTNKWDRVTWNNSKGYVTDEYVDTQNDVSDPNVIPAC